MFFSNLRFLALVPLFLVGLVTHAAAQPAEDEVRISGTVQKFENGIISLSPSTGIVLRIRFDAGPGIHSMRRVKFSDLRVGQQVSVGARSSAAGNMVASQVIVYEQGAEQAAGGSGVSGTAQPVGRITEIGTSADGLQLSLAYAEGDRKVSLLKEAMVWIARPAGAQDIRPGAIITIFGRKPPGGEIRVIRASIGQAGGGNPPL